MKTENKNIDAFVGGSEEFALFGIASWKVDRETEMNLFHSENYPMLEKLIICYNIKQEEIASVVERLKKSFQVTDKELERIPIVPAKIIISKVENKIELDFGKR